MGEYNILILSGGRRVELVKCFQNAARRLDIKSNVIVGDSSDTAPALYFAERAYILPRIHETAYIDTIIDICNRENIALIVPTIDTDLLLLAERKNQIEKESKAVVLVSDKQVIRICRDKTLTRSFLKQHGFNTPRIYTSEELEQGDINYPLIIKPKSGSSSNHVFQIHNKRELEFYRDIVPEPIVQDFLDGQEYTVDIFLNFISEVITIVPRLRLATRGGEISKGKIIKDNYIIKDCFRMISMLKPIGQITVQLIFTAKGIEYIEINPRFGGGTPMSIYCGADSCEKLFRLLRGDTLEYNEDYQDNLMFLRFDNSICLNEKMEVLKC